MMSINADQRKLEIRLPKGKIMTIDRRMGWVLPAVLITMTACGGDAQADTATPDEAASAIEAEVLVRVINVEVQEVAPTDFEQRIPLTGVAQAMRDVVISSEEAGVVREIVTDKGRSVSTGQTIFRLDDAILSAQVQTAQAQATLAKEVWGRRKKLFEEEQIGSEVAYLEARYQSEQTEGTLKALEERLARTRITAPISGILEQRMVEVGTMVSPGTPVARVVQINPVKIAAGVPERFALAIQRGAKATVTFDVMPGEFFQGSLNYVGATVDAASRTFLVEMTLSNRDRRIKPEMVAKITVIRGVIEDAIVVSQDVLVRKEDGFVVFVIAERAGETVAVATPVVIGATQGNDVLLASGLEPGQRYVVVGQQQVADGDRVRLVGDDGTEG